MTFEKEKFNKPQLIDAWSLTPIECSRAYLECILNRNKIALVSRCEEIFNRKIKAFLEGEEFLPEYYDFAEQIEGVSLDDFRNSRVIQKDFGFRDQRPLLDSGNKQSIDYIYKDGKYIKEKKL